MLDNDFNAFSDEWITANELSANGGIPSLNKVFDMLADYSPNDVVWEKSG